MDFARFDILLDGKYPSWVKFANSLRLRLAMRIASVAPDKACAEIQKIKENDYGFFEVKQAEQSFLPNPDIPIHWENLTVCVE